MLYLAETDFGERPPADKPRISFAAWLQYIVSNYAAVAEGVEGLKDNPIYFVPAHFGPAVRVNRRCMSRSATLAVIPRS